MSVIDIRSTPANPTALRFADQNRNVFTADILEKSTNGGGARISDSGTDSRHVRIFDKVHAENLIKALNTAIELGWLE